ncbi:MAG: MATE family efflux transporter, partial [Fusobacterium periodonticum]|nr:MATE family efflux transporter [Fusobacterium periodonticum]
MKTMFKNNDLTQGKIWKVILNFTLPIFLGTLFQSLYTTIDAIIVGKFAGKDAFAAIESVMSFQRLPVSFFIGLSSGATIIISQYFGAKEKEDVSKASHTAMLFAIVGGLILSILS